MKAFVLHGPHRYGLEQDWPEPKHRPGSALVRVHFCGICGSDLPRFGDAGSYHYPIILGHEFTGVVESSELWEKGARVAVLPIMPCGSCAGCRKLGPFHCEKYEFLGSRNDGGMAQLCLVPDQNLLRLPGDAGLREGTLAEPLAVALHVLRASKFKFGMSAAVVGAGTIGLLIALWLREFGASKVIVADIKESARKKAGMLGFSDVVDPLREECGAADLAIDAAGSSASLQKCVETANPGGKICVIGRNPKDTVIPAAHFERFMRKELELCGIWGYDADGETGTIERMFSRCRDILPFLMEKEISLEEAKKTMDDYVVHNHPYVKTVINIQSGQD